MRARPAPPLRLEESILRTGERILPKKEFFRFAHIGVMILSEADRSFTLKDTFQAFRAKKSNPDIHWYFWNVQAGPNRCPQQRHFKFQQSGIASLSGTHSPLLSVPRIQESMKAGLHLQQNTAWELRKDAVTIVDFARNRADLFQFKKTPVTQDKAGFGPVLLASFMPKFDALLLHASAIVRHGRAAVFLAPDAGGKTTAVCLSPAGTILSDDQVIVRRVRKRFRVWGTPWGLHVSAGTQAPLAGLFLLKKADHFSLQPLLARDLVPRIWEEIKNPLSILPKPLKKKAFGILCDIAAAAPSWTLSFPRDRIDWKAIDQALAAASIHDGQRVTGKRRETFIMEIDV